MTSRCVVALGANLGDRLGSLNSALRALAETPGVRVAAVSPVVVTTSVGGPAGSPDYLNAVTEVVTTLGPDQLLRECQRIEHDHGRQRLERWGPRTLDLDLVWFQGVTSQDPRLTLPHPRAHERAFVLVPWALMDPHAVLAGIPVPELADDAPDRQGLRRSELALTVPDAVDDAPVTGGEE